MMQFTSNMLVIFVIADQQSPIVLKPFLHLKHWPFDRELLIFAGLEQNVRPEKQI